MTPSGVVRRLQRILVALDASRQSQVALDAAAALAEWSGAELHGIYVEDIDLIRLAALPVGQEIGLTASPQPIESQQVARRLSYGATEARRSLAETANRRRVRWRFRVERGNVPATILQAAGEVDIVAVGRAGAGRVGPGALGSTARALATQPSRSVIVVQTPLAAGQTVVTIYDGSASCARAVDAAANLCVQMKGRLVVLISTPATADREHEVDMSRLPAEASDLVKRFGIQATVRPVDVGRDLISAVREEHPALCVVGCETAASANLLRQLTDQLRVSVYLVT